jgi:hypothetical protein
MSSLFGRLALLLFRMQVLRVIERPDPPLKCHTLHVATDGAVQRLSEILRSNPIAVDALTCAAKRAMIQVLSLTATADTGSRKDVSVPGLGISSLPPLTTLSNQALVVH